jgi:hypothetical protein
VVEVLGNRLARAGHQRALLARLERRVELLGDVGSRLSREVLALATVERQAGAVQTAAVFVDRPFAVSPLTHRWSPRRATPHVRGQLAASS